MMLKDVTTTIVKKDDIQYFEDQLRGYLIRPDDGNYDEAREIYNAMIDKRPGLIVCCTDTADVVHAVDFARENDLTVAVRSGGHNGAGLGSCDNGMVIDLSQMNRVRVDPETRTALVEGGCTWADVDTATHAFGLATVSGTISTTGVGGLTLGGGHGHLSRQYGLTIDNLIEVEIVLADGSLITANEAEHSDLFWAIRGGGGNFGVVTAFKFQLHPVDTVIGGPTLWPLEQAEEVMKWYRAFILDAPEELNGFFAFLTVPPAPPFPEELHLKKMCGVIWCYNGSAAEAERVFKPVKEFGPPALHGVHEMPYPALQSAFDDFYPPGLQWYWRGDFVIEISDEAIERHLEHAAQMPTPLSTMHMYPIDGAVQRVGRNETAFSYREANWSSVIAGVDPDPANADRIKQWVVDYWEALHPYSAGGAYVNFLMKENQERLKAAYRDNYKLLVTIKNKYDPTNLFHVNQNIEPTV